MPRFILFVLILLSGLSQAQYRIEVRDLSKQIMVYSDNRYVLADSMNGEFRTHYLFINASRYRSHFLEITSAKKLTLFVDGQWVRELPAGESVLSCDSLAAQYPATASFAFYSATEARPHARVIAYSSTNPLAFDLVRRLRSDYLNFTILSTGILFLYFVLLFRFNPRLLFDYFNFVKLFSLQEREENLFNTKILASGNLLVYGWISMVVSLLLLTVDNYSGGTWIIVGREDQSVGGIFLNWLQLSLFLFAMIIVKSMVVYFFSRLFDFGEAAVIQFFNFIRLLCMTMVLQGLLLAIYFVFEVDSRQSYEAIIYVMSILLLLWLPLVALKLLRRSPFTVFHLFSYLCASEIFPVVIVIKLLFF